MHGFGQASGQNSAEFQDGPRSLRLHGRVRTKGLFGGWRPLLRDPAPAAAREDFGDWIRSSSPLCAEGVSSHVNFAQLQSRWRRRAALAT